jgi:hypothetical protein
VSALILLAGLPLERTEVLLSFELENLAVTYRWPTFIRTATSALIRVAGLPLQCTDGLLSYALQHRAVTHR